MKPNDKAIEAGVKLCWDCPRATPSMIRDILTAAYAAQFPPSENYAGLVKWLRDKAESLSEIYPPEAEAADALEAVLAERDALKAELAAVTAERDAAKKRAYEDAARFIEENVLNYSSTENNYWSKRKGGDSNGLEYAKEFRARAAIESVTEPQTGGGNGNQ